MAFFCALHRKRPLWAGGWLATATALRIFPVFFLVPLVAKAGNTVWSRRRLRRKDRDLFASFALTSAMLVGLTTLLAHSPAKPLEPWAKFRTNMQHHIANVSPNLVGLSEALALNWDGGGKVSGGEFEALKVRRTQINRAQLLAVFLPSLLGVVLLARRRTDLGAAVLGLPLLYLGLSLAAYYYIALVALILAHRHFPRRLALVFGVEAAVYVVMLFEQRDAFLHVYRGLLLAFLFAALEIDRRRRLTIRRTAP